MASRIFWVMLAGLALVVGMVLQDGRGMLSWGHDTDISARTERSIESSIDRAIDGTVDKMEVIGSDGREIDVPPETKRAMADAVGQLVKAEADLAILRVRDGSAEERQAAETRRTEARAEVDRLKAVINGEEDAARADQAAVREQVRREIRDEIRAEIRDAARN